MSPDTTRGSSDAAHPTMATHHTDSTPRVNQGNPRFTLSAPSAPKTSRSTGEKQLAHMLPSLGPTSTLVGPVRRTYSGMPDASQRRSSRGVGNHTDRTETRLSTRRRAASSGGPTKRRGSGGTAGGGVMRYSRASEER